MKLTGHKCLVLVLLSSYFLYSSCQNNDKPKDLPNIVILFVDDLGYYDIGFRNQDYYTPNIDQLAKESMVFNNAYVPSPTCSPSRVALYTGKHPASIEFYRHCLSDDSEYNMWDTDDARLPSRNWLPLEETTYAEVLKQKGYSTFFCGKWHLGGDQYGPQKQGFDEVWTNASSGAPKNYYPIYFSSNKYADEAKKDEYLTDFYTDKAIDFIKSEHEKPFLLQFSYHNVHTPNIGKKEYLGMYRKKGFEGKMVEFGAQVSAVDESVGKIQEAIKASGLEENTIIVFVSDQGSLYPNTPLRGTKEVGTALYEGSAKIPFLIKWPDVVIPGSKSDAHVSTLDIFPTLMSITGKDPKTLKNRLDGLSLLKLLNHSDTEINRDALYFYRSYDGQYASILRDDNWKLIAYRDGHYELFKVDEDISETNDVSVSHPKIVKNLLKMLHKWEAKYIKPKS